MHVSLNNFEKPPITIPLSHSPADFQWLANKPNKIRKTAQPVCEIFSFISMD